MATERPMDTRELHRMVGAAQSVGDLERHAESLRRTLDPDVAAILVTSAVTTELAKYRSASGVSLAREDAEARLRDAHERKHDEDAMRQAAQFDLDLHATIADLESKAAGAMRPPVEANADRRDLRSLVLFRLYEGQTLADITADYERTPDAGDGSDPTLISMVETRTGDLSRLFKLRATDADAAALGRLQTAINARRALRADPKAAASLERLKALQTMGLRHAVNEARRGELKVARNRRAGN